ncbi:hypothetical protein Anas_12437 [Armadillidium nasatum]|uniref:Uncharacterized protein n=1 Tax=Armadillidium nasatum TaxID=96803 RepID=A0A5N5T448_9CRUS|nr:hypothetical protein Anas_12437 [Armadillidium nasatum]
MNIKCENCRLVHLASKTNSIQSHTYVYEYKYSADCSVAEQLVTAVGIPTGSTLPPPSPQIEQNLSKHNPECALSESRSTETGIKIINSRYNKCDVCDLQTKSTDVFIQHLFKEHIRKIITKPKRNKSLSLKPTKHWPKNLLLLLLQF